MYVKIRVLSFGITLAPYSVGNFGFDWFSANTRKKFVIETVSVQKNGQIPPA